MFSMSSIYAKVSQTKRPHKTLWSYVALAEIHADMRRLGKLVDGYTVWNNSSFFWEICLPVQRLNAGTMHLFVEFIVL